MNNERIKWLDDFNRNLALARSIASSVDRNGEILALSGNVVMGERLEGLANVLDSALDNIDAAISTMVSEEARASTERLRETFIGVLNLALSDTPRAT
jgi:hypothetical protein